MHIKMKDMDNQTPFTLSGRTLKMKSSLIPLPSYGWKHDDVLAYPP